MYLKKFLTEPRRRNVYRAAAIYGMVGWLLVQIASQTFPVFAIPSWAVRFAIVLLIIAFPLPGFSHTRLKLRRMESWPPENE